MRRGESWWEIKQEAQGEPASRHPENVLKPLQGRGQQNWKSAVSCLSPEVRQWSQTRGGQAGAHTPGGAAEEMALLGLFPTFPHRFTQEPPEAADEAAICSPGAGGCPGGRA